MNNLLFVCILFFAFSSKADFLDQVTIYLNETKVWNTSSTQDGKDIFTDTLNTGDTLLIHAVTDWNELSLARLVVHDMYGNKVKELPRKTSAIYGAQFEWILSEEDFQQEFKIALDYNIKDHPNWWFATLTNKTFVGKNLLKQELYDAETIWDSIRVKAEWFQNKSKMSTNLEDIPSDFSKFYTQFLRDSSFQREHVAFSELIGVFSGCDTTIRFNKANMYFNDWDFTPYFDKDNHTDNIDGWVNYFFYSDEHFYYEFRLKEIGMIYRTGFQKINGEWQLTLYFENAC